MAGTSDIEPATRLAFEEILRAEGLDDPSWVLSLDEFDEPPLFSRASQVEFLRAMPSEERLTALLRVTLEAVDGAAREAAARAPDRVFFVCATFSDFDLWQAGEQLVPTAALYVDPRAATTGRGANLRSGWTRNAADVACWLRVLGPQYASRFCVGELAKHEWDPETARVYVGWRIDPAPNVRSVGTEIDR